jgi:hypothetical protein
MHTGISQRAFKNPIKVAIASVSEYDVLSVWSEETRSATVAMGNVAMQRSKTKWEALGFACLGTLLAS